MTASVNQDDGKSADPHLAPAPQGAPGETPAFLEISPASRVQIFFTVRDTPEGARGYFRLAFGEGSHANRLLATEVEGGRLITASGETLPVAILSYDPAEAPGYLCSFHFVSPASAS
jgi:hypothetical protein